MSRIIPLVVAVLVSPCFTGQVLADQVLAQLTPPAGTAGAGLAPINGRTVPPIPGRLPIRAASATTPAFRHSAPITRRSPSPRRLWRRHAPSRRLIIQAHRSRSSTRRPSIRGTKRAIAGQAARRSARSRGFAGGVSASRSRTVHSRLRWPRVAKKFTAGLGARDRKPCGPTCVRTHRTARPVPGCIKLDG
jgi:hypothetical protein